MGCRNDYPYNHGNRAGTISSCITCFDLPSKCQHLKFGIDTLLKTSTVNRNYMKDDNANAAHKASSSENASRIALDLSLSPLDLRICPSDIPAAIDLSLSSSDRSGTTYETDNVFFRKPRPTSIGFMPQNDTGSRTKRTYLHSKYNKLPPNAFAQENSPALYRNTKPLSSSESSTDLDSSPMYCSTSSSDSLSSPNSKCTSPFNVNTHISVNYVPLSPTYSSKFSTLKYSRTTFEAYSPLSPKSPRYESNTSSYSTSPSLKFSPDSTQYSSQSPNCYGFSPNCPPGNSLQYKYKNLEYSLASPQSPVYNKYSSEYSPLSPRFAVSCTTSDNKSRSPTFIDSSPISPICTPSSSSYCQSSPSNTSPECVPFFWGHLLNSESCTKKSKIKKNKSPSSTKFRTFLNLKGSPPSQKCSINIEFTEDKSRSIKYKKSILQKESPPSPKYSMNVEIEKHIAIFSESMNSLNSQDTSSFLKYTDVEMKKDETITSEYLSSINQSETPHSSEENMKEDTSVSSNDGMNVELENDNAKDSKFRNSPNLTDSSPSPPSAPIGVENVPDLGIEKESSNPPVDRDRSDSPSCSKEPIDVEKWKSALKPIYYVDLDEVDDHGGLEGIPKSNKLSKKSVRKNQYSLLNHISVPDNAPCVCCTPPPIQNI